MEQSWADFEAPTKIKLEKGAIDKIGDYVAKFGGRVLLVNIRKEQKDNGVLERLQKSLNDKTEGCIVYDDLYGDPDTEQLDSATYFARKAHADVIVAYGGMDTFNTAKAISLLSTNTVFADDLISGKTKAQIAGLPIITVPMEPSQGEELLPSLTLVDAKSGHRKYFEHPGLFPKATFYDPSISVNLNPENIARLGGGLTAYCVESALSNKSGAISLCLVHQALENVKKVLVGLYKEPENESYVKHLLWASAMTGLAIPASPLGNCWAVSIALMSLLKIDYQYALSITLPHIMEYYLTATPQTFVSIARSMDEDVSDISVIEAAIKAVESVRRLFLELNLPTRLSEFDIHKHQLPDVAKLATSFPQIENAPKKLSKNEIESILLASY